MDELEQQEQEQKGQGDVQEEELVRFQFRKVCGRSFLFIFKRVQ